MINFKIGFQHLPKAKQLLIRTNKKAQYQPNQHSTFRTETKTRTQLQKMQDIPLNNKKVEEWLEELDNQIILNISKINFTIDDLASYMGISKRQLYRLINERLGETPHTYLKKYRLNYAQKLLREKQVNSVKAAAYSTGFPNVVYFSRQFKSTFGYLPSELL